MTKKTRRRLLREAQLAPPKAEALVAIRATELRAAAVRLAEAGRVLSAANEEKLRTAQEAITAVLASLADTGDAAEADSEAKCDLCGGSGKIREGSVDCPDCGGSGLASDVKKEAKQARLLGLAEAYSSSAEDAADGAFILSCLLELMGDESDEPDELPILQVAFAAITQWLQIEVAEIGGPEDVADSNDAMDIWGWEAARKRLSDSGGPIRPREGRAIPLRESKVLQGNLVPISEAAVRPDGSVQLKIIEPGWGSSGFYPAEVLERDGPSVFPAGTKTFWDHPTMTEEWDRPERSLRDLAGELTSDARWEPNGPAGPGLYADAKVFDGFAETVNEIAPSIGVSIRAYGVASQGTVEGQTGSVISELVGAESVDFVTTPGAGGQVLQLFEAARQRLGNAPIKEGSSMEIDKDPKFLEAQQRAARAEEKLVLREAKDIVALKLAESQLPELTRARLAPQLAASPPVKEGALDGPTLEKQIDAAIEAEKEYLAGLEGAGQIRGMGQSGQGETNFEPALEGAFKRLGLDESAAKIAAKGRHA